MRAYNKKHKFLNLFFYIFFRKIFIVLSIISFTCVVLINFFKNKYKTNVNNCLNLKKFTELYSVNSSADFEGLICSYGHFVEDCSFLCQMADYYSIVIMPLNIFAFCFFVYRDVCLRPRLENKDFFLNGMGVIHPMYDHRPYGLYGLYNQYKEPHIYWKFSKDVPVIFQKHNYWVTKLRKIQFDKKNPDYFANRNWHFNFNRNARHIVMYNDNVTIFYDPEIFYMPYKQLHYPDYFRINTKYYMFATAERAYWEVEMEKKGWHVLADADMRWTPYLAKSIAAQWDRFDWRHNAILSRDWSWSQFLGVNMNAMDYDTYFRERDIENYWHPDGYWPFRHDYRAPLREDHLGWSGSSRVGLGRNQYTSLSSELPIVDLYHIVEKFNEYLVILVIGLSIITFVLIFKIIIFRLKFIKKWNVFFVFIEFINKFFK